MRFISLGGWCGTTVSLRSNSLYGEALPFDHIRSRFIGIIDCFETNFKNFFPEKIEVDIIEKYSYSGKSFRGKYFGFFYHNLLDNNVINDIKRRIDRLTEILTNTKEKIVFIRTIVTHNYNDELDLSRRFLDVMKLKFPSLDFILIFVIPGQNTTQYYKSINEKTFVFTVNDINNNGGDLKEEYKPIYDYILNNDLFTNIPKNNEIDVKNGYNSFVEFQGVPVTKSD